MQMETKNIVTIIVFVLGWVNAFLVKNGIKPLPVLDQGQVSLIVAFVISVITMVKENPFKKKSSEAGK
jgi:SPP1 family holin